jgi:hypothetical protein
MTSRFLEHQADAARQALPCGFFVSQPLLSGLGQAIKTRAPIVFGRAPICRDPALPLQALQRRVQRPLLDLEDVVRELTDPLRDRPAVERLERDGLEDE